MTLRAAIYLRISLDRTGEQLAIDRQREDCLAIVKREGWEVTREYVDNSISASDSRKQRPGYDAMVRDFQAGRFDALVCYNLDRLTRQTRQLEDWIEAAETRGLRIVTANGEADLRNDDGRMFVRVKAAISRGEVERKSARQTRAMQQRIESGRTPAGVRLTGYTPTGRIKESEAAIVRELFDRFLSGDSLRALADDLERRRVKTRSGGSWHPSTIRTVLMNARYAGWAVRGGEIVEQDGARIRGEWEPIVTEGTYDAVQRKLRDPARKTNRVGTDRKHLGSGLYLCAECGRRVRSHSGRYRCPDGHVIRSREQVDAFVLAALRGRLAMPDLVDLLPTADDEEATRLTEEINELRQRLATIEHDYDENLIDGPRYAAASRKARARIEVAQARRTELTAGRAVSSVLDASSPVKAFDNATLGAQRTVLDVVMQVSLNKAPRGSRIFDPDTVTIEWRTD